MKKLKIFLTLVILVEIFIMLLLINGISNKEQTITKLNIFDFDLPDHPYTCGNSSSNTKLRYELKPNCSTYFDGFKVKIPTTFIKINSDGFRDKEYSIEKPNNTYRIIVLGDSFTFGEGVSISTVYTEVLERKLNSLNNSINYEVLNFGVPGYNTKQEIEIFKGKGLKYDPDMIMLQYHSNDIHNKTRKREIREEVTKKYEMGGFNITETEINIMIHVETENTQWNELKNKPFEDVWHIIELPLEELNEITSKKNIPVVVIGIDLSNRKRQIPALRKTCEKYNWSFINLEDYGLRSNKEDIRLHPKDWHFNKLGHQITANALFGFLLKKELI